VLRPAVSLLEHPDEEVRMQALVLCEHFEDPRLIGPVVKLLDDPTGGCASRPARPSPSSRTSAWCRTW
jgi:HEAT repeat protein